jgi:ABC-type polysaccharide/polyol phosphate transport system ATPase subunit
MMTTESNEHAAPDAAPMATREKIVRLRDVGIWYRRRKQRSYSMRQVLMGQLLRDRSKVFWALRHVDLSCHEGQVLGIVGPNGAGKSTLCLVLAGILLPDEGDAEVRGRVSALLSLGAGFSRDLSGRENIMLSAAYLGIPRRTIEHHFREIVGFAELEEVIDEPVRTYSSGMKARLGFSVAASLQPEVLILDEVLSVGDLAFQNKSRRRIEQMIQASKLIIIVSHDVPLLRGLSTHSLWLEKGSVREYGDSQPVLAAFERSMDPGVLARGSQG